MFDLTVEQMEQNEQEWLASLPQADRDWVDDIRKTNAVLVGYEPSPTHQIELVDNAKQNAGVL